MADFLIGKDSFTGIWLERRRSVIGMLEIIHSTCVLVKSSLLTRGR
ncbi:unnamed protein product [Arabidopsis halleri]